MSGAFRFNPAKFVDAVVFLVRQKHVTNPITRMKIVKLLYLADRHHLARHGTPILGDRYYRLPFGPIPSRALDLLEAAAEVATGNPEAVADEVTERLLRAIKVGDPASKYATYAAQGFADLDTLSRSETDALASVAERFGGQSSRELSDLTHQHKAWTLVASSQEIPYELFFTDEEGVNPEAVEYFESTREDRVVLERLRS